MNQISRDQQGKRYPPQPYRNYPAPPPRQPGARRLLTAGLLYGGLVIAAIALFLPWVTVSVSGPFGGDLYKADASPFKGGWIFVILLVIAGAAWLAWPTVTGSTMPIKRLAGLTAVVGLQILCLLAGFVDYANGADELDKTMGGTRAQLIGINPDVSIGFGFVLYAVAVVAIAVGLVQIWMHRSKASLDR
jgi:hypothetical protein